MDRRFPLIVFMLCGGILLGACGQDAAQPSAEAPVKATQTAAIQPVGFEPPVAGQHMLWPDSSTLVYVPGGPFIMGQDEKEPSDHNPAHTVSVSPYWIYQAEITNRMYRLCVDVGVCSKPTQSLWYDDTEYDNAPVSGVDWDQAQAYCKWMNGRLPTEAEWELAARGTEGDPYPWGKDPATCDQGNFLDCLVPSMPTAVRSYPLGASPYKAADMAGNVSEWVYDWYADDYYATSPGSNPLGPSVGEAKVVRGSSYLSPTEDTEIFLRGSLSPGRRLPTTGFRCVVNRDAPAVAPICSALSYDPTWDPLSEAWVVERGTLVGFKGYCGTYQDDLWYRADVEASFRIKAYLLHESGNVTVTSPQGNVTCKNTGVGLSRFAFCEGDALKPGQPVTLTFCFETYLPAAVAAACPASYEFNPSTAHCEYSPSPGGGPCNGGVIVEGYGCLYPPVNGQCPAAHYGAEYNGQPVCVPAAGPTSPDPEHPLSACPKGLVFDESNLCCEYPPDVSPACPVGFVFDAQSGQCNPEPANWCETISGVMPSCEPTLEPPPPPDQVGCWIASVGPPRCVFPCPDGVPNSGPCTP